MAKLNSAQFIGWVSRIVAHKGFFIVAPQIGDLEIFVKTAMPNLKKGEYLYVEGPVSVKIGEITVYPKTLIQLPMKKRRRVTVAAQRKEHEVDGHIMKLPTGKSASPEAKARARAAGKILGSDETWRKPHKRGQN